MFTRDKENQIAYDSGAYHNYNRWYNIHGIINGLWCSSF